MALLQDIIRSGLVTVVVCALLVFQSSAFAQIRSSSNYQIESDSINAGGGLSNSASFTTESTVGEVATGQSTSTNFSLQAGFQQLREIFVSLRLETNSSGLSGIQLSIAPAVVDADLSDFPVYVDLANLGPFFWAGVQADGRDIRVVTANTAIEVPYELVAIDAAAETGELHFKAPLLSATDTTEFIIYFNDSNATAYAPSDPYGAENVWTNDFVAVLHLEEDGSSAANAYRDSTGNGFDGTGISMTSASDVPGQLGRGQNFDGISDYIDLLGSVSLSEMNISVWAEVASTDLQDCDGVIFSRGAEVTGLQFGSCGNASTVGYTWNDSASTFAWSDGPTVPTNELFYTSLNVSSDRVRIHAFDSAGVEQVETDVIASAVTTLNDIRIGEDDIASARRFNGLLDEVRIASTTRTASWVSAEHLNQSEPTSFYSTTSVLEQRVASLRMAPALPGLTGGVATGSIAFNVETNNAAGYEVTMQSSGAPAMQRAAGLGIPNYNDGNVADFTFTVPPASAVFGFTPSGDDIADAFLDDGTTCGVGTLDTDNSCWSGVSTTPIVITQSANANLPAGVLTTLLFQVGIANGANIETGEYIATTTLTALPL